jgi:hypothetical protein
MTSTPAPFHMYTFEVWPDPLPAASYPMLVPDHVTVKAAGYDQARDYATDGLEPGRTLGAAGHLRSQCYPPHPGAPAIVTWLAGPEQPGCPICHRDHEITPQTHPELAWPAH